MGQTSGMSNGKWMIHAGEIGVAGETGVAAVEP